MGHIKEPVGIDLNIGPMPFTAEDRQEISEIIARYKNTGELPSPQRKSRAKKKLSTVAASQSVRTKAKVSKRKPAALESGK